MLVEGTAGVQEHQRLRTSGIISDYSIIITVGGLAKGINNQVRFKLASAADEIQTDSLVHPIEFIDFRGLILGAKV